MKFKLYDANKFRCGCYRLEVCGAYKPTFDVYYLNDWLGNFPNRTAANRVADEHYRQHIEAEEKADLAANEAAKRYQES